MRYQRYRIEKIFAPNIVSHPPPFKVKINRWRLLKLLIKELFKYRGKKEVILSRPCAYGVFSGIGGGFFPRQRLCVGCLRCTTEQPDIATILHNPKRKKLGCAYLTPDQTDTLVHEASKGSIVVKGAGYRGKFGGERWEGIWTDMSEIVRPTRDGIYGRELISTEINLGEKPLFLTLDNSNITSSTPLNITLPFPLLFDTLPDATLSHPSICTILSEAARQLRTFAILPFEQMVSLGLKEHQLIPLLNPDQWPAFKEFDFQPRIIELSGWNREVFQEIKTYFPGTLFILRTDFEEDLISYYREGVHIFHLAADYSGVSKSGLFISDLIRSAHLAFVKNQCRDAVSLIGSGGINASEHLPKAILSGLDAAALDIPLIAALQGNLENFVLPAKMSIHWGVQRIKNLMGAWQDLLVESAGAMGLREIRRMRGEVGRVLYQKELENEAFAGIKGYAHQ